MTRLTRIFFRNPINKVMKLNRQSNVRHLLRITIKIIKKYVSIPRFDSVDKTSKVIYGEHNFQSGTQVNGLILFL